MISESCATTLGTPPDAISRLKGRASELAALLESWCNINSGSANLAGLERMRGELRAAFSQIRGAQVEEISLAKTEAKALRVRMRPEVARARLPQWPL